MHVLNIHIFVIYLNFQFNLHGNRRYLVEWTTSAFMLGNMIGASSLTYLSDK